MEREQSLSDAMIKHIGYGSEEWIKQVLMEVDNNKVSLMKPYIGSVIYPGDLFPPPGSGIATTQFQATTYVGLMEFVFPDESINPDVDGLPAFTLVEIDLDGVNRQFIQIAGGDITAGGLKFSDYVYSLYPNANQALPHNPSAFRILRNVKISGSKFNIAVDQFLPTGFQSGSHTKDYGFCVSVSGYSIITN